MEIIEGIHRVDEASSNMAHSNVYLVMDGKDLIVIDTGTSGNAKKIVSYIEKLGRQPSEVSTIILTHYHMDHAGSAKDLQELTGAKVAAGDADAEIIEGKAAYPKPKNLLMRAASIIKPAPVPVEVKLKDGDAIGRFSVIETPGHTPGSIMLYNNQRGVLFCGDTFGYEKGKITEGPEHFTWSQEKELESIEKVATLNFDVLLPGHGGFLKGEASAAVAAYAKTLKP